MKNEYKSFIRNYLISSSLYDFIFAYAIYTVFFSINGLSPFEISLILAWWAFVSVILEIPSGALADHWSRKKLLVIAPIIKSFCFIIWVFAKGNIYLYGLGFVFWSIGSAFVSGTSEALLYDHIVYYNKKENYEKILGKKKFYLYVGNALSVALGGIIAHYSLEWTLILSIIPLLLSSIFATLIKEVRKVESTEDIHYIDHIKEAYKEVKNNNKLFYLLLYSLGISIFRNLEEFDQLYYELIKVPLFYFGFLATIYFGVSAIGSKYAHKFKNSNRIFWLFPLLSWILLIFVGMSPSIPMILFLMLSYFIISPLRTLNDAKIQHTIKSQSRATVTSIDSLFLNLFGIIFVVLAGIVSKLWNLEAIYTWTWILLILFSIWSLLKRNFLS